MSESVGLGQLRSHTCGYLERVLTGETIDVIRRGDVVARIVPAAGGPRGSTLLGSVDVAVRGAGSRIRLDDLRKRAGRYFDRVAAGERIEIVWHGRVVAELSLPGCSVDRVPAELPPHDAHSAREPVGLEDFRRRTGRYLDQVAAGETIEVARRGQLVARITPAVEKTRVSA